ncbi:MAG: nucleotidyltransferase substrate binding protein [Elusimicrobia bacterium]|nr:nucleotidyltransferase substrate binding protein [Elusimicrobiota bacterium]
MEERLKLKISLFEKSLQTFEEILSQPYSVVIRDASMQRFEYTFEAMWKFLKEFLKEMEGIVANSPKAVFREAFGIGLISEPDTEKFLEMTDSRNDIAHTYKEEVAKEIFERLPEYLDLMRLLDESLKKRLKN